MSREYHGDYAEQMRRLMPLRGLANERVEALPGGHTIMRWDKTWVTIASGTGRGNIWDRGQDGWCKCGLHAKILASDLTGERIVIDQTGRPCGVRGVGAP